MVASTTTPDQMEPRWRMDTVVAAGGFLLGGVVSKLYIIGIENWPAVHCAHVICPVEPRRHLAADFLVKAQLKRLSRVSSSRLTYGSRASERYVGVPAPKNACSRTLEQGAECKGFRVLGGLFAL